MDINDVNNLVKQKPKTLLEKLRLRSKNFIPTARFDELTAAQHRQAFTVAKIETANALQNIFDKLDNGIAEGKTIQEMKKDLLDYLPKSRLTTVIQTNLSQSYRQGRWEQQQKAKDFGLNYLQWIHTNEGALGEREEHSALHMKVFRADDPWLLRNYPPCEYNCACYMRALTDSELAEMGLKVTDTTDLKDVAPEQFEIGSGYVPNLENFDNEIRNILETQLNSLPPEQPKKPVVNINENNALQIITLKNSIIEAYNRLLNANNPTKTDLAIFLDATIQAKNKIGMLYDNAMSVYINKEQMLKDITEMYSNIKEVYNKL